MSAGIFAAGSPEIIGVGISLRISETHGAEAAVTRQPIEDGSTISDHIILQPDTVEIVAEIGNYDGDRSRTLGETAKTSWAEFKRQLRSRQLFDVLTYHELYTDMALEALSGDHTSPRTGAITCRLRFVKVDVTQTSIVRIPATRLQSTGANPVDKTASSEIDGGTIAAQSPDDNRSLAAQALDVLGG